MSTARRFFGLIALVLALVIGMPGMVAAGAPASTSGAPTGTSGGPASTSGGPSRKLTLGINMVPDRDLSVLDAFSESIGGNLPGLWAVWGNWGDASGAFPAEVVQGLAERGVTPMMVWQPQNGANIYSPNFTYKRIARGKHDAYIKAFARAAKASGTTIVLRFAHEMDGHWFPWGIGRFDNTSKSFKAAWRHVWNIFRGPKGVGARNVKFLWSPSRPIQLKRYAKLYPGDRYVDYVGFTAFNWARGKRHWRAMADLYTAPMTTLRRITRKPVIVAETGTGAKGGDKAAWIRKGYPAVYRRWSRLKAVVYFNVDMREGQNRNWLLSSPPAALDAFADIAAQARFQGRFR